MFCFKERGSRCSLCVNGRQILPLVKISSVCGWCYIQMMLFFGNTMKTTPPQHEWQIISHPLQCFHGYADMRNKTCPGGFNFVVVDFGRSRSWVGGSTERKGNQVMCYVCLQNCTHCNSQHFTFNIWYHMNIMIMIGNNILLKNIFLNVYQRTLRVLLTCFFLTHLWHVNPL